MPISANDMIRVAPGERAEVVDDSASGLRILVGEGARLDYYRLQADGESRVEIELAAGATCDWFLLLTDGKVSLSARLLGEGAAIAVKAAYKVDGDTSGLFESNVAHLASRTESSQLAKGVVGDSAHSRFLGKIHIARGACGCDAQMLHKALLLSETARAEAVPELEIYNDDVKCSHGAAFGQLDAGQMFYLQSRGIGLPEARAMLVAAHLDEVVEAIGNNGFRERARAIIHV